MPRVKITKAPTGSQADYGLVRKNTVTQSGDSDRKVKNTMTALKGEEKAKANIEVEGGETVLGDVNRDGYAELFEFKGKRHAQGGMDVDIPEGSFIFSDTKKLKIKDKEMLKQYFGLSSKRGGYTPAEISKKFQINEFIDTLKNPESDEMAKRSADEMIKNNMQKLGLLAFVQESIKGFPDGIPDIAQMALQELGVDANQMLQEVAPQQQGQMPPQQEMMNQEQMPMAMYGKQVKYPEGGRAQGYTFQYGGTNPLMKFLPRAQGGLNVDIPNEPIRFVDDSISPIGPIYVDPNAGGSIPAPTPFDPNHPFNDKIIVGPVNEPKRPDILDPRFDFLFDEEQNKRRREERGDDEVEHCTNCALLDDDPPPINIQNIINNKRQSWDETTLDNNAESDIIRRRVYQPGEKTFWEKVLHPRRKVSRVNDDRWNIVEERISDLRNKGVSEERIEQMRREYEESMRNYDYIQDRERVLDPESGKYLRRGGMIHPLNKFVGGGQLPQYQNGGKKRPDVGDVYYINNEPYKITKRSKDFWGGEYIYFDKPLKGFIRDSYYGAEGDDNVSDINYIAADDFDKMVAGASSDDNTFQMGYDVGNFGYSNRWAPVDELSYWDKANIFEMASDASVIGSFRNRGEGNASTLWTVTDHQIDDANFDRQGMRSGVKNIILKATDEAKSQGAVDFEIPTEYVTPGYEMKIGNKTYQVADDPFVYNPRGDDNAESQGRAIKLVQTEDPDATIGSFFDTYGGELTVDLDDYMRNWVEDGQGSSSYVSPESKSSGEYVQIGNKSYYRTEGTTDSFYYYDGSTKVTLSDPATVKKVKEAFAEKDNTTVKGNTASSTTTKKPTNQTNPAPKRNPQNTVWEEF